MKLAIAILLLLGIGVSYMNVVNRANNKSIKNRKTVDTVIHQPAEIKIIKAEDETIYVVRLVNQHINLCTTNIPVKFKEDNKQVYISGAIKETPPMEDEYGQHFIVNSIIARN